MNNPKTIIANMRGARIERLLSTPPRGFLVSKGFRRFLCVVAVVFSYFYLFTMLVPVQKLVYDQLRSSDGVLYLDKLDSTQSFLWDLANTINVLTYITPLILLLSFLLLRTSMRRITSLPDEYLDELEIVNRDWAFRTGYLVVRRLGLAVTVVFLALRAITFNPSSKWDAEGNIIRTELENALFNFDRYLSGLTSTGAISFYFNGIALLTFVAYSFPLILLAWRESKFPEALPEQKSALPLGEISLVARKYFRRVALVALAFIGYVSIQFLGIYLAAEHSMPQLSNALTYSGVLFFFLFIAVPYAMFVYIWASIKTVEILKAARQNDYNQGKNAASAIGALVFFVITQLLGLSIPVLFSQLGNFSTGRGSPILAIFAIGLAMIPTQVLSFIFVRKLGKQQLSSNE
jgi:hypothetical protein